MIGGEPYIVVHLLKITSTNSEFVRTLEMILALPMALGELGLAIWLLVKGGKESTISNEASSNNLALADTLI